MYHWRPRPSINEMESNEDDVDCGVGLARERAVQVVTEKQGDRRLVATNQAGREVIDKDNGRGKADGISSVAVW
jgi:hypothetical protein